jgi:hypothetical protein
MKNQLQQISTTFFKRFVLAFFFTGIYILSFSNSVMSQRINSSDELLQEFFIGQTVYAQHRNEIQFTIAPVYWKKQVSEVASFPLQLEYGLSERFQFGLELPYSFGNSKNSQRAMGIGNAEIGFLYTFFKDNKSIVVSLAMGLGLPTEKREKGVERAKVQLGPSLIVARQIGKAQVHTSFGVEFSRGESAFNYNLATVYPFADWRATIEVNSEIDDHKIIFLTPGLIWKGIEDFEFGLGISKSVNKNSASCGVILMITHEFSFIRGDKRND